MKQRFCLWRFMAAASGLDEAQACSPRWRRHLRRCPPCAADHAKQKAVSDRLAASAARYRPLPQVDAVRLARVAIAQGREARRDVWVHRQPVWKMAALAALLVALAAILPLRTPDARPPVREVDDGPSADALVESALSWAGGMLRGAMLEAELQRLIHDAETLAYAMADEVRAPFPGIASL